MSQPIVAPDTGILLAIAYGPESDPRAPAAAAAIQLARDRGAKLVAVSTVSNELNHKLDQIEEVYNILQVTLRELASRSRQNVLQALEEVTSRMRAVGAGTVGRYIDAVERRVVARLEDNPGLPIEQALADILASAVSVKELARLRIEALRLEPFMASLPTAEESGGAIEGVGRKDFLNLRACQELSKSAEQQLVFVVQEGGLHGRREQIREHFPGIVVTNPTYLRQHLPAQP